MSMEPPVRYRMVGAIVLIFVAVVFLPWLFDGAGFEALQDLDRPIPERPLFVEPHTPAAPVRPPVGAQAPRAAAEPLPPSDAPPAGPVSGSQVPATESASMPVASTPPPAARSGQPAGGSAAAGWVVQAGSFGREANAREQLQRLRESGFSAFVEHGTAEGRDVWRVKVGPRPDRDEALRLRDELQRRLNIAGIVVAHP